MNICQKLYEINTFDVTIKKVYKMNILIVILTNFMYTIFNLIFKIENIILF